MRSDLRNHRISESDLNIPGIIIDCDSLSGYPIVSVDPKNYLFDGPLFGAGKPCVLRPVFGLVAWVGNRDNLSRRRARVRPAWSGPHEQSAAQPRINRARCTRRSRGDLAPNSRRPLRYRLTCRLTCRFSLARDERTHRLFRTSLPQTFQVSFRHARHHNDAGHRWFKGVVAEALRQYDA